jgi:hypothetical protein
MYGRTATTDESELSSWLRDAMAPVERLPGIVTHELVHTFRIIPSRRRSSASRSKKAALILSVSWRRASRSTATSARRFSRP